MIPKKIYKIWVGEIQQPAIFNTFLNTWENAVCHIVPIGNESVHACIYDTGSTFLQWAWDNKRWALVNHYLRYWLLWRYGGYYMDLDVQVIRKLDLSANALHIGMESERWLNNCFMAAPAYHEFFKDCMDSMEETPYDLKEIELETGPRLVTNMIQKHTTWKPSLMEKQELYQYKENFALIYPERYFSPHRWYQTFKPEEITKDTYTVHHYVHSWK